MKHPGGPNGIARVLKRGSQEGQSQRRRLEEGEGWRRTGEEGMFEGATLLALKMGEGVKSQGTKAA